MTAKQQLLQQIETLLLAHPQGLGEAEIARRLGVNRTSIAHLLPQLEENRVLIWEDNNGQLGIIRREVLPKRNTQLDRPLQELRNLLEMRDNEEAKYQEFFRNFPWVLGTHYESIERHQRLDSHNIPDFTGVRVWDNQQDIFEIKPPFMPIFRSDGEFTSGFNESWNQAERYLDLARLERDYLRRRGLNFDNPRCILILGFNLPQELIERINAKQRITPSIQILTYDNILKFMTHVISLLKTMSNQDGEA
ncbi:MAG: DUF4263 domain-containing protein [Caldilineaceae bacterium]|nr:DUF4263 domain-containing protein [Caldilineaceae bacterium]